MIDREKVIEGLREMSCRATWKDIDRIRHKFQPIINDALALLKEQEAVVRCEDCENWIPGYITDHDDFIPPKCGKYQQMVGHSAADYCSLAERKESR